MDRISLMQVFVDICHEGSLAAVARSRGLAPSVVTGYLKSLESQVGARLLVRTTRRMRLTSEGERFLADCRRIVADVESAMERVSDDGPLRGRVRITTTNDFGRTRLPPLIDGFLERHPELEVELYLSDGVVNLAEERFDLALRTGPLADSRFRSRLLLPHRRLVCAAPHYWERAGRPEHPSELEAHNCLVLARPGAPQNHWLFQDGEERLSVRVSGNRSANDGGALREWAVRGVGVVLKSAMDVRDDLAAGRLESVLDGFTGREINLYAVYPSAYLLPRRVELFLDYLQQRLRGEAEA